MASYLGFAKATDALGKQVRLTRPCENGLGEMPAGTKGKLVGGSARNGHLRFKADACECCGLQWSVSGLHWADVALAEEEDNCDS